MASDSKFAVLIDADNISGKYIKIILDEISNDGIATYKRIYGDWTSPALVSWKNVLLDNSILPIQQYSYTTGKNSTDSAMIIDAMDILYSGQVDGFCIVSSDSDFTRLAARLRESGMPAPEPCPEPEEKQMTGLRTIKKAIRTIVAENSDEDGWLFIGTIGNLLVKRYPDFDVRNFGYSKLTPFIESLDLFDIKSVRTRDSSVKLIYVKLK